MKMKLIKMKLIQLKTKHSEPLFEQFVACFEHDIGLNAIFDMTEHLRFLMRAN